MRKFGWIPDSEAKKIKDLNAEPLLRARVASRPAQASLRHLILSILDQANLGSCVANAGAQAVRASLAQAVSANPRLLSRLFTYYYARAISPGDTSVDSGTQIRCFFDVIRKLGYCPEDAWPYDTAKFAKMPGSDAIWQAVDQKISVGYHSIASSGQRRIEDICTAVAGGHLVVFGTIVGNDFVNWRLGAPALTPPTDVLGGHALCVTGYRPGPTPGSVDFDICNSWGPEYGDNGYCTMSNAYLAWGETRDLWIVESASDFSV
jgi:C1A family cysteine protease